MTITLLLDKRTDASGQASHFSSPKHAAAQPWLITVALVLAVLSIGLRLYQLDSKLVWCDEERTFDLISSKSGVDAELMGEPLTAKQWRQAEHRGSNAPVTDMLDRLRLKTQQDQAPVYYVLTRCWTKLTNDSPGNVRLVSVVGSVIAFPLVFALATEMFQSATCGWLSVALLACSPFQLLFAQEARPYTIWLCLLLCAWLALSKALNNQRLKNWLVVGVFSGLSVMTHFGSFVWLAANFAGVACMRSRKAIAGLVLALTIAALTCTPWFLYAGTHSLQAHRHPWLDSSMDPITYTAYCYNNLSRIFCDLIYTKTSHNILNGICKALVVLIETASILVAYKRATRGGRAVVLSAVIFALILLMLDIVCGGRRLTVMRYLMPSIAVVQICVASMISILLATRRRAGLAVFTYLILIGMLSCTVISSQTQWWTKLYNDQDILATAKLLNSRTRSAMFICNDINEIYFISRLLNENVRLELAQEPRQVLIPGEVDTLFVCQPGPRGFAEQLHESGTWSAPEYAGVELWKLNKSPQFSNRQENGNE